MLFRSVRTALSGPVGRPCQARSDGAVRPDRTALSGLPTYLPTDLPTYLTTCLTSCLPTYIPTYLPPYLPTYLSNGLVRPCRTALSGPVGRTCEARSDGPVGPGRTALSAPVGRPCQARSYGHVRPGRTALSGAVGRPCQVIGKFFILFLYFCLIIIYNLLFIVSAVIAIRDIMGDESPGIIDTANTGNCTNGNGRT